MADTKIFEKILRMKERERKAAQQAFAEKQQQFESAATTLYELLKKKKVLKSSCQKAWQLLFLSSGYPNIMPSWNRSTGR